jgi:hypothetical protein
MLIGLISSMPLEVEESEFRFIIVPNTLFTQNYVDQALMRRLVVIPFNPAWTDEQQAKG